MNKSTYEYIEALENGVMHLTEMLEEKSKQIKDKENHLLNLYKKFGRTFEKFAPFTKQFPGNKWTTVFVGDPIDFVCFDKDKIIFVEVKTGNALLTSNQQRVKDLVEKGKVEFREVRY